jgi:hypothetical protein
MGAYMQSHTITFQNKIFVIIRNHPTSSVIIRNHPESFF